MRVGLSAGARTAKSGWVLSLLLIAATFACSPPQRHSVLDFVFDGVPPYRTPEERAFEALAAAQREAEAIALGPQRTRQRVRKLARFTHGPFAANECTRCHDLTTASGFRGLSGGAGGSRAAVDLAEAGRLRMPVNELCIHCHTDFTDEAPGSEGLWLHGPVASGWCILCHQPHSARYPYLLSVEPTARLCTLCHLRDELVETAEHRPLQIEDAFPAPPVVDAEQRKPEGASASSASIVDVVRVVGDCTKCHDPHMGPDRLLLRPRHQWEDPPEVPAQRAEPDLSPGDEL